MLLLKQHVLYRKCSLTSLDPAAMADGALYEVERLLGKKLEKKQVFYLVRWKNYPPEYDTWEPAKNLKACKLMFKQFDKKQKSLKSASVAARLLKKSKELSSVKNATKNISVTAKKANQIIARQKIAAELKTKTRKLAKLETLSKNKSLSKFKTKKTVSRQNDQTVNSNLTSNSEALVGGTVNKSAITTSAKKKNSVNENKKVSVKKTGSKRASDPSIAESKDQSLCKEVKQHNVETSQSMKHKTVKIPNEVKESAHTKDSISKNKILPVKPKSGSNTEALKDLTKVSKFSKKSVSGSKISVNSSEHLKSDGKCKMPIKRSKSKDSNCEVTIVSDSESDDDDILYSLTESDNTEWDDGATKSTNTKAASVSTKVNGEKSPSKKAAYNLSCSSPNTTSSNAKRLSLMDFKKPKTSKQKPGTFEQLLRPSSPTPVFTPLKAAESPMLGTLPNTTLTMHSFVGDVPHIPTVPPGPLSPSTLSYRSMLDSLPSTLTKAKKRKDNGSGTSSTSGSSGQSSAPFTTQPIERRTSVRAVECVFRYKQIVVKKCQRYTQIWLNTQTTMKNAFNPQVVQEVVAALNTAKYDDSSLVLFSGVGNFFCSGIDLHFLTTGDRRVAARQMSDALRELTKAFITFPKPVMAAVGGSAVGLGVGVLCLCDIVYASDKASFHLPYTRLSQPPEGCASFTLPLNLGLATANELLFGGRRITALEAHQLGLVSQVFWPTTLMQEVIPRAQNMAKGSPRVLENTKLLIRSHHRTKMELTNETECNLLLEHWSSNECQRAMEAYLANDNNFSS